MRVDEETESGLRLELFKHFDDAICGSPQTIVSSERTASEASHGRFE
jgi:hypothetical protein